MKQKYLYESIIYTLRLNLLHNIMYKNYFKITIYVSEYKTIILKILGIINVVPYHTSRFSSFK